MPSLSDLPRCTSLPFDLSPFVVPRINNLGLHQVDLDRSNGHVLAHYIGDEKPVLVGRLKFTEARHLSHFVAPFEVPLQPMDVALLSGQLVCIASPTPITTAWYLVPFDWVATPIATYDRQPYIHDQASILNSGWYRFQVNEGLVIIREILHGKQIPLAPALDQSAGARGAYLQGLRNTLMTMQEALHTFSRAIDQRIAYVRKAGPC